MARNNAARMGLHILISFMEELLMNKHKLFLLPIALLLSFAMLFSCDNDNDSDDGGGGTTALMATISPIKAGATVDDQTITVKFNKDLHPDTEAILTATPIAKADVFTAIRYDAKSGDATSGSDLAARVDGLAFVGRALILTLDATPVTLDKTKYVLIQFNGKMMKDMGGNAIPQTQIKPDGDAPTLSSVTLSNKSSGGTKGTLEEGDKIAITYSEPMITTIMGKVYHVVVPNTTAATKKTIGIYRTFSGGTYSNPVALVQTFDKEINTHVSQMLAFNNSKGVWSADGKTLTITLAAKKSGTSATGIKVKANGTKSSAQAGAGDLAGIAALTTVTKNAINGIF